MPIYKLPNIPGFLTFRVFFNARFYYPVFALMFLDFGLSLSEFSLSNLIWAAAIVSLEVPSGAMADVIGRRKLVVLASLLMIVEMAVLLIAKPEPGTTLLTLFCLNRFLSGAGEAMASGADEALAFDTLKESGLEDRWAEVLEWQTRLTSVAFFVAMLLGAAVYDPRVMNSAFELVGLQLELTAQDTLKLPLWLTLGNAFVALAAALSLKPLKSENKAEVQSTNPWKKVAQVGRSLLSRRNVLVVILTVVLFDMAARASLTMSSNTFSAYGIEAGWFGVISACFALLGFFISGPARRLVEKRSQGVVFSVLATLSVVGLAGQAWSTGIEGLFFLALLSTTMNLVGFCSSYYLNQLSESEERATLLSFKGLLSNIGFGTVSLYYAAVCSVWSTKESADYLLSLYSLLVYFLVCLILFGFVYRLTKR